MNGEKNRIADIVDVRLLQSILDDSSRATGLAFVTVDYRGAPITEYSGFSRHCQMMRRDPRFSKLCEQCDAHGGLQAAITGQPSIYLCHAGLMDFAVPLIANGSYIGAILGGQVRLSDVDRQLSRILPGGSDQISRDGFSDTDIVSYEKILSTISIIQNMLPPSLRSSDDRSGMAPDKRELGVLRRRDDLRYFFFAMNVIARTAASEKARKTETAVLDFSDMMRYATDSSHSVTTIGEEINYVRLMARMMRPWSEEILSVSIDVDEDILALPSPYMVMQPVMENAVYGVGDALDEKREIAIEGRRDGADALISFKIADASLTEEMIASRLRASTDDDRLTMDKSNERLKRMFGNRYGITSARRTDGAPGCEIIVRIPFKAARDRV